VRIELDSRDYLPRTSEHSRSYSYIELVERYFQIQSSAESFGSLGQQKRMWMSNIALALDKLVEKARGLATRTSVRNGGIDEIQADHWRHLTLDALTKKRIELDKGHFRSLLTLTQAILDGVGGDTLRNFEWHLHMTSAGVHEYEAELELLPVDEVINDAHELGKLLRKFVKQGSRAARRILRRIPAGALIGSLVVRKRQHGPFEARYVIILIGAKFSRSVGTGSGLIRATGVAKNSYGQAWRPEHFPGRVVFLELGASASAGGSGKGGSMTLMTCHGSGPSKPPAALGFNLSGLSDIIAVGAGGGVAFMYLHGWILPIDADGGDVDLAPLGKDTTFVYGAHSAVGPLHFPINGAKLTDEAAALLEIFACCELPVLSRKGVTVEVNGYADQPDKPLRNEILSRNRAISVYHFLKNILGDELATPELKEIPTEKKEYDDAKKAKAEGESYTIVDPSDGVGRVKIVGHGAPKSSEETKKKAEYDPELRRADLWIDGDVRIALHRKADQ
jgi:hypothetical protein